MTRLTAFAVRLASLNLVAWLLSLLVLAIQPAHAQSHATWSDYGGGPDSAPLTER